MPHVKLSSVGCNAHVGMSLQPLVAVCASQQHKKTLTLQNGLTPSVVCTGGGQPCQGRTVSHYPSKQNRVLSYALFSHPQQVCLPNDPVSI